MCVFSVVVVFCDVVNLLQLDTLEAAARQPQPLTPSRYRPPFRVHFHEDGASDSGLLSPRSILKSPASSVGSGAAAASPFAGAARRVAPPSPPPKRAGSRAPAVGQSPTVGAGAGSGRAGAPTPLPDGSPRRSSAGGRPAGPATARGPSTATVRPKRNKVGARRARRIGIGAGVTSGGPRSAASPGGAAANGSPPSGRVLLTAHVINGLPMDIGPGENVGGTLSTRPLDLEPWSPVKPDKPEFRGRSKEEAVEALAKSKEYAKVRRSRCARHVVMRVYQ